ncbi:MAG: hypothetical protein HKN47_00515 [Pirellulaceae bacterium]|nr:hypothetical protein [Pirellulaceae bacterium]
MIQANRAMCEQLPVIYCKIGTFRAPFDSWKSRVFGQVHSFQVHHGLLTERWLGDYWDRIRTHSDCETLNVIGCSDIL